MATAESRHVMKALASFGPGGAFGVFCEKLIHIMFPEAYEMEDPNWEDVRGAEKKLQELRKEFVELLFEKKGQWGREIKKSGEPEKNAYDEIKQAILESKKKIAAITKTKLIRERVQFNKNSNQYKRRL